MNRDQIREFTQKSGDLNHGDSPHTLRFLYQRFVNRGCYAKLENDKETIESRKTNAYITSLLESIEKYNDHKEQQLHKESVDAAAVCFLRSCEKIRAYL